MERISKLGIFCGSRKGSNGIFEMHAKELGELLCHKKVELIFGGGKNGLMGVVADAAMCGGGIVRGVIPKLLSDWEAQHDHISELEIVEDMHVRKRRMYELCDAVIVLPGGYGTLDEIFEVLTWNQLSIHNKKVFLLNSGGFYDHLLAHIDQMHSMGFLYNPPSETIVVLKQPSDLAQYL